jgi:hypothetical protein
MTVDEWRAARKEAGLKIDPKTAEVDWEYGQILDPYGIYGDELPEECDQIGRIYFARSPGSDVWVAFADLPDATRSALWDKYHSKLALPAGPFDLPAGLFDLIRDTSKALAAKLDSDPDELSDLIQNISRGAGCQTRLRRYGFP